MSKYATKEYVDNEIAKLPGVGGTFVKSINDLNENTDKIKEKVNRLGFPLVVKSNNGGSSIGLFVASMFFMPTASSVNTSDEAKLALENQMSTQLPIGVCAPSPLTGQLFIERSV